MNRPIVGRVTLLAMLSATPTAHAADGAVKRGYDLLHGGDSEGAVRHFDASTSHDPDSLPLRFGLAAALFERSRERGDLEARLERELDLVIARASARDTRSRHDAEALFYLANAHLLRGRYRYERDKGMWGAARDGASAKRYIDRYVQCNPEHGDAYYALGAYNYYVELAPAFVRVLRLLLFLPSGNRVDGLRQLERAASEGDVFAFPAAITLAEAYGWYEGRIDDAVRVARRAEQLYPGNLRVPLILAELYGGPAIEDHARSAKLYRAVRERAERAGPQWETVRYNAAFGYAVELMELWRPDDAIVELTRIVDSAPTSPRWVMPRARLMRGNFRARVRHPRAREDAEQVKSDPQLRDWHRGADEQLAWIAARERSQDAAVYAALIEPNRLMVERRWDEAGAAYERVRQQFPHSWDVRYRIAELAVRRGDLDGASSELDRIARGSGASAPVRAAALLQRARVHDLRGRREDAVRLYKQVLDDYEKEWAAGPARLGIITPYRRYPNTAITGP